VESEADAEVDRIMQELTAGVLRQTDAVPTAAPPAKQQVQAEEEEEEAQKVS
jgi:hypothetical protein